MAVADVGDSNNDNSVIILLVDAVKSSRSSNTFHRQDSIIGTCSQVEWKAFD